MTNEAILQIEFIIVIHTHPIHLLYHRAEGDLQRREYEQQYSLEYNITVLRNQLLHFPVVVAICKKEGETQPQQRCQYANRNSGNQYMLSIHRKQTYNRNYHYTRLFHSLSSHSAILQHCYSIEMARNSSPLHLRIPTLFLLAMHRIHNHVHTIKSALHSLRNNASLKNEVTIDDIIPFYVTRRAAHSLPTSGEYGQLHSTLVPCSRYYHSI